MAWKPKTFKMRYFPADSCSIEKMCAEIIDAGLIIKYGDGYACIPSFKAHQHINPRESPSTLPCPIYDASTTRQPRVSDASQRDSDAQGGREGKGKVLARDALPPPEGVDQQIWQDYLQLRKAKKATVSKTVIESVIEEAAKLGLTLNDALKIQIKRGWQGFESDWVTPKDRTDVSAIGAFL